jgi:hypothetical protein
MTAFAKRIGEYARAPASEFVGRAEEHYADEGGQDPVDAANEAIQMWENEGADMAGHFEVEWAPGEI